MRILVVTPWFPTPSAPGSGIFNLRDAELLARDHDVRVLHLHDPALPDGEGEWHTDGGIAVTRRFFSSGRPGSWLAAVRAIRSEAVHADAVHTMAFPALLPVSLARLHLPWVHTEHWSGLVTQAPSALARLGSVVLRRGLRRPGAVIAVGRPLADAIDRTRRGLSPTTVIGNRVRLGASDRLPEAPEARGSTPLRLIAVGNLVSGKGPIEAIDAVAELESQSIDANLEWAGTGPLADEMLRHAAARGIGDRVTLLGFVPPEELSEALLRAHVFVLPTEGETFGVAFAEALGHGLPVVGSGVGGHQGFLPAQASRLTAQRSGPNVADAIMDLVNDNGRWRADQIAAFAREQFSEESRRAAYREVYARVMQGAANRQR